EAAALYCLSKMDDHNLSTGDLFLVVDSGGGTVDLTMRVILEDRTIGEITERSSALCGSTYVDRNFIAFLEEKFGKDAIKKFKENHYQEYQYLIHNFFCQHVKFGYTGEQTAFKKITLDFNRFCPKLKEYVNCSHIRMSFDDIKEMFDPVVETIINLIKDQLSSVSERCSAIFLVGGFSESYYLTKRIEDEFKNTVPYICVSPKPITSVVRGAVMYGLNKSVIKYRILTMYYGVKIYPKWEKTDPKSRRTTDDRIYKFNCLAKRGQKIELDRKCSGIYMPVYPDQKAISFKVFASPKYAEYCDDPGMRKIGNLHVNLPDVELGLDRLVEFSLMFGELAITAVAVNKKNGNFYTAVFDYVKSDFDLESF
ncbi:1999_t:CDS:2, partial [Acaulospora morrowiae]